MKRYISWVFAIASTIFCAYSVDNYLATRAQAKAIKSKLDSLRQAAEPAVQAVSPPLGTPEAVEIRNDPSKPLQITKASCLRVFEENKPRCTAEVQFAKTGGPWSGYTLLWTLRYEDGKLIQSKWTREGRMPDGVMPDFEHFHAGQVSTIGSNHTQGVKDKTGRQLTIVNAAVEAILIQGGSGGGGHR